jgi:HK97 family phage portal protein
MEKTFKEVSVSMYSNGKLENVKTYIPVEEKQETNKGLLDINDISKLTFKNSFSNLNIFGSELASHQIKEQYKNLAYSCINLRAENVAKAIPIVKEMDNQTDKSEPNDHPIIELLNNPNPDLTKEELYNETVRFTDIFGNCFWEIVRDNKGNPAQFYLLPPEKELWKINYVNGKISNYQCKMSHGTITFDKQDILHFKLPNKNWNSPFGMSMIEAGIDTFYMENSINAYQTKHFDNDGMQKYILSATKDMQDMTLKRFLEMYNNDFAGQLKAGMTPIFPNGIDAKVLSTTPKESDFIETWKMIQTRTLSLFRISPSLLGIVEDVNRANDVQAKLHFINFIVDSIIKKMIDSTLTRFLRQNWEQDRKLMVEHNLDLPLNREEKRLELSEEAKFGTITINEYRKERGRDPIAGGDVLISKAPPTTQSN